MIFTVTIDTSNAVFDGSMTDVAEEVGRIVNVALSRMVDGSDGSALLDVNGNTVGHWAYTPKEF